MVQEVVKQVPKVMVQEVVKHCSTSASGRLSAGSNHRDDCPSADDGSSCIRRDYRPSTDVGRSCCGNLRPSLWNLRHRWWCGDGCTCCGNLCRSPSLWSISHRRWCGAGCTNDWLHLCRAANDDHGCTNDNHGCTNDNHGGGPRSGHQLWLASNNSLGKCPQAVIQVAGQSFHYQFCSIVCRQ